MLKRIAFVLSAVLLLQVFLPALTVSAAETPDSTITVFQNEAGVTLEQGSALTYDINVSADTRYFLEMEYKTIYSKAVTPQIGITVDSGSELVLDVSHIWVNETVGERFETDDIGNERIPAQHVVEDWQTVRFLINDDAGYSENGFELKAGAHKLNFNMIRESIVVREIRLVPVYDIPTYEEYVAGITGTSTLTGYSKTYEAELAYQKSHPEISVSYDRSSPSISPNDPVKIVYNVIGGSGYATPGQWLSWQIEVPEDGYYNIDFKYRQNTNQGQSVRRQMYVDGEVLYKELDEMVFASSEGFRLKSLSVADGESEKEAPIYLTKGTHEIKLKVILGSVGTPLEQIEEIVRTLNDLYTQIVIIVGETPDSYRDYDLDDHIPGLLETFSSCADKLSEVISYFEEGSDERNSNTSQIEQVINLLEKLANNARKVPTEQDNLRAQINTLASLVSSLNSQPLEIDTLTVRSADVTASANNAGFWDVFMFRVSSFLNSFVGDYNSVGAGDGDGETIDVWVTTNSQETVGFATGRDQAQIVTQLVRSDFFTETGIMTNISLMSSEVILQAFASGKGPDTALFVPSTVLANLYFRNAVVDLTEMENFSEIKSRAHESAFVPLSYNGKVFGLPEVQSYNMMYYRTDIFEKHGLEAPRTWDEFYDALKKLQKNGMQVGVTAGIDIYEAFLMQNGGTVYKEDLTSTNMTTDASIVAFAEYTDLYVKYSAPLSFSPLDRFRTGQIPLLISPATFYNQLAVGAIEINNLWAISPMPGELQEDGTINHTASCKVSAAMILKSTKNKEAAFKFLEWWTRDKTQQDFAFECEIRFGISARYFPANISTLETMSWGAEEYAALSDQRAAVNGVPQSPATYYLERNFTNAFRKVAYDYENPRDVIYRYGRETDEELDRKLRELGLIEE